MASYTRRPLYRRGGASNPGSLWLGSRVATGVPEGALLTEASTPILTELGEYILVEH